MQPTRITVHLRPDESFLWSGADDDATAFECELITERARQEVARVRAQAARGNTLPRMFTFYVDVVDWSHTGITAALVARMGVPWFTPPPRAL